MSTKENNISQITDYLKGRLDARAMYELERNAQDDPFLMEALDGFEIIGRDQSANLADLQTRLTERVAEKKERSILLWRILPIAACLLIAIGGYWLFELPSKQQHLDNVAIVKHPTPAIKNVTKYSAPNLVKKLLDSSEHLTKNRPADIQSSSKTANKPADSNSNVASKNDFAIAKNAKAFYGGDVATAIKNLPRDVIEKNQIVDDYAFKSSYQNRKTIGNYSNTRLKQGKDTGAAKYLNTDLLSVNTRTNAIYGAASTPDKDLTEPVIRGYVKRQNDQINGQQSYIITGKEVQDNPVGNVEQLLQGKVAGLNIQNNAGAPGMRGSANIRGLARTSSRLISGKVTDTAGVPLAGIFVHGANASITSTDASGRYHILANQDSAVVFRRLGYQSQNIRINPGQSTLDVKLKEGSQALAEVDVMGYRKHTRNQTTGASYIITGKDGTCKENLRFKKRFFAKIAVAERYVAEHAKGDSVLTIKDSKFLRALKFIAKRAPTTLETNKTIYGYADLKVFAQNKERWLHWYELNKCKHLK